MKHEINFTDEELTIAAGSSTPDIEPAPMHVQALRAQLLTKLRGDANIEGNGDVLSPRSPNESLRSRMFMKVASLAALIMLAVLASRTLVGTAAASLKSALDATRHEAWIHAVTVVTHNGDSNESEAWCSPEKRIAAYKTRQSLHFVDYSVGIQASYSELTGSIAKWRANMHLENSGHTFVQAILKEGDLAAVFPFHSVSSVKKRDYWLNNQAITEYSFEVHSKGSASINLRTIVRAEVDTGRIVAWEEQHASGLIIVTVFDYPAVGPMDIYELGADSDAVVVDRVASSDVMELAQSFKEEVLRFEDYHALVIDKIETAEGQSDTAPLIRKLWRNGKKYRVELLSYDSSLKIPADPDLSWWRSNQDRFEATLLAECDGATCRTFPSDDLRLDLCNDMFPRFHTPTTIPVVTAGKTSIPVWPSLWPEYACRPLIVTDNPAFSFEIDVMDQSGPPNSICLRLLAPDMPIAKERATYWLDLAHGRCVSRAFVLLPVLKDFSEQLTEKPLLTVFSNFEASPSGIAFATRKVSSEPAAARIVRTSYLVDFAIGP